MKVGRMITAFEKNGEKFLFDIEFELSERLTLEQILEIVPPKENDPLLYDPYSLAESQFDFLRKHLPALQPYDFQSYDWFLEAFQA
jgi:hypothetical protein